MRDIPYNKEHVLNVTAMHMKKCIDKSVQKSFERIKDKPEKSEEILETIDVLYRMKKMLDEFESNNPQLFGDKEQ